MANSIEFAKNYTGILDEVYQRAAVSRCLNSGGRMVHAGRNAKEILIPKISVTGLGDYTRNVGYKTGSITYEYETHSFGYNRAIRLFADVMDVEEGGVLDCFVEAGAELQRTQVAPEGDAYTFSQIAGTEGVTRLSESDFGLADETEPALQTHRQDRPGWIPCDSAGPSRIPLLRCRLLHSLISKITSRIFVRMPSCHSRYSSQQSVPLSSVQSSR